MNMSLIPYKNTDVWRSAGQRLRDAGALLPTPVHEALHCLGMFLTFISEVVTSLEISKEVRQGIQVIADRAERLSRMIEKHPGVFQRDGEKFLERFKAVVTGAREFFETVRRRGLVSKIINSKRDKATWNEFKSEINELHVDFIAHLAHERDSKGPHELITSNKLQHFWKYRMKDVHEVRWESFWRQFLAEFPQLDALYFKQEETRMAVQSLSREGHLEYVSPWGVNNMWEALKDGDLSVLTGTKPRYTRSTSLTLSVHPNLEADPPAVGRSFSTVVVVITGPEYHGMNEAVEYVGDHPSWFKRTYGSDLFDVPSQLR